MRTLKKTLCLVLAIVMVLGLGAFSVSAKYADEEQIQYKEAVDVLSAIGVLTGMDDGTFSPKASFTRAQAATMIARIMGAGDVYTTSVFDDTKGHWAEGAISFCAARGIINGVGDNKFDPDATLTGSAWAKMLLCAVGFDAEEKGMTGDSWEVGTAALVKSQHIADDVKPFNGSNAITREEAAALALRAMKIEERNYIMGMKVEGQGISVSGVGRYEYLGTTLLHDLGIDDSIVYDTYYRPATQYVNYRTHKAIATVPFTPVKTYTDAVRKGTLFTDLGGQVVYDNMVFVDYDNNVKESTPDVNPEHFFKAFDTGWANNADAGVLSELYCELAYDSLTHSFYYDVTLIHIHIYAAQAITDYNSKAKTLKVYSAYSEQDDNGKTTYTFGSKTLNENVTGLDLSGYKYDDWVLLTFHNGNAASIQPADSVTGKVTSFTTYKAPGFDDSVTVNGNAYGYGNTYVDDTTGLAVNENFTLVLDPYGNVIYLQKADDAVNMSSYVFIKAVDETTRLGNTTVFAAAYFTDGSYKEITLGKLGNGNINSKNQVTPGWYSFSTNSDGTYNIKFVAGSDTAFNNANITYKTTNGTFSYGTNQTEGTLTGETVFVVLYNHKVSVYNGIKNAPVIAGTAYTLHKNGSKAISAVFVDAASVKGGASSDVVYVYDVATYINNYNSDGTTTYTYTRAMVNGEAKSVTTNNKIMNVGVYNDVSYNDSGVLESWNTTSDVATVSFDAANDKMDFVGGVLTIKNQAYNVTDSCKAYVSAGTSVDEYTPARLASASQHNSFEEYVNSTAELVVGNDGVTAIYITLAK